MAESPIAALKAVARQLDKLDVSYAFLGGAIVSLLLDHPELSEIRPTEDVDVVIEVVSNRGYSKLESRLRELGFLNDTRQGAPICRWLVGELVVDIMPTQGTLQGLNTAWFAEALESSRRISVGGAELRVVSPVGFLATKYAAYCDRGRGDFFGSTDIEDMIAVIDGRSAIVEEIDHAQTGLRGYVSGAIRDLNDDGDFQDALSGLLPMDAAGQARLPDLRGKLNRIAALAS